MTLEKSLQEDESGQPKWLSIFRIILGLILFWKGISFIYDSSNLQAMVKGTGIGIFDRNAGVIAFLITYINLLGGLLIIAGLFTRWAAGFQIPILISAVFFGYAKEGMGVSSAELLLSAVVLVLLVVFLLKGSGVISADEYFRNYYKAGYESGHTKKLLE